MTRYVASFLFNPDRTRVVLIRKVKPTWQKGLLNGMSDQSKIDSMMETITNTAIGFVTAMVGNAVILPWLFGIELSVGGNFVCATAYTVISIVRQYTLRRAFNGRSPWSAIKARFA